MPSSSTGIGWKASVWLFINKNEFHPAHDLYCFIKSASAILPVSRHHKSRPHSFSNVGVHSPVTYTGHWRGSIIISDRYIASCPTTGSKATDSSRLGKECRFWVFFCAKRSSFRTYPSWRTLTCACRLSGRSDVCLIHRYEVVKVQ